LDFDVNLKNLKRLFRDSEKQLQEFNESIPYEHNPENVFSPKLVNLILQAGPQIENLTDMMIEKLEITPEGNGLLSRIKTLNKNNVLSNFQIHLKPELIQFTPFDQKSEWWSLYNSLKHDLSKSQFDITYLSVMNSMAALASLHRLADVVKISSSEYLEHVLTEEYWRKTFDFPYSQTFGGGAKGGVSRVIPSAWESSLFRIANYFVYADDL